MTRKEDYLLIGNGFRIKKETETLYRVEYLRRTTEPPFVVFSTLKGIRRLAILLLGFVIKEKLKGGAR